MTTDNEPPFSSHEFKTFSNYMNVKHRRITPLWPQANASAENFNKRLRKVVQSARLEKKTGNLQFPSKLSSYASYQYG